MRWKNNIWLWDKEGHEPDSIIALISVIVTSVSDVISSLSAMELGYFCLIGPVMLSR